MRNTLMIALVGLGSVIATGCGGDEPHGPAESLVVVDDGTRFAGGLIDGELSLQFDATQGEQTIEIAVFVDKKALTMAIPVDLSGVHYQGGKQAITAREKEALRALSAQLDQRLGADPSDDSLPAVLTTRMVSWLAAAPVGVVHDTLQFASKSRSDDGVRCIKKNTYETAKWDINGVNEEKYLQVNSTWDPHGVGGGWGTCMGRCGADCGWGAPSSYTIDCLDHDACLSKHPNQPTSSSSGECGDEWSHAVDDWTLGVPFGCLG